MKINFRPDLKVITPKKKKVYVLKRTPIKKKAYKISKMSEKRKKEKPIYNKERLEFLGRPENQFCFIEGCNKPADTVEHSAGRGANYLNKETWRPCCWAHNIELENNPELSKKYQVSKIHGGKKL